jgi:non-specific serine/threonine protein kinase
MLLVLDNCEHLIAACAAVAAAILQRCPGVKILATSREQLGVPGEHLYAVPPMAMPPPDATLPLERLAGFEAITLFVARARAQRPDFVLTAHTARAVLEICRRLDGIPLAIELAAARVGVLGVDAIAARLDDRFRLLTGGPRTAPTRQQTLQRALDWSYDLLSAPEQRLLRLLSVFSGGWTLPAAEQVCTGDLEAWEVLDLLSSLVAKSLVEYDGVDRYRLLETVRQYAAMQCRHAGEEPRVRARHLAWCIAFATDGRSQLRGAAQTRWLETFEAEHDNLRAALRWSLDGGNVASGVELAGLLPDFWMVRGYHREGRAWLGLAIAQPDAPPFLRARALQGMGNMAYLQSQYPQARAYYEQAISLLHAQGDRRETAAVLSNVGSVAYAQGDYAEAQARQREALAIARDLDDTWMAAALLNNLGMVAQEQQHYPEARRWLEESLALQRTLQNTRGIALVLRNLGQMALAMDDLGPARAWCEESLALQRTLGDPWGIALALNTLGHVAYREGALVDSRALHRESLALQREFDERRGIAESLEGLARIAVRSGSPRHGILLYAAGAALRAAIGTPLPLAERAQHAPLQRAAQDALGDDAFHQAWHEGETLALKDALDLALAP